MALPATESEIPPHKKRAPKHKQFVIEQRYIGESPLFKKIWGEWKTWKRYGKEESMREALKALNKNQSPASLFNNRKRWEYRVKPEATK